MSPHIKRSFLLAVFGAVKELCGCKNCLDSMQARQHRLKYGTTMPDGFQTSKNALKNSQGEFTYSVERSFSLVNDVPENTMIKVAGLR